MNEPYRNQFYVQQRDQHGIHVKLVGDNLGKEYISVTIPIDNENDLPSLRVNEDLVAIHHLKHAKIEIFKFVATKNLSFFWNDILIKDRLFNYNCGRKINKSIAVPLTDKDIHEDGQIKKSGSKNSQITEGFLYRKSRR